MPILDVKNLQKNFGKKQAVAGVDLHVNKAEIVGLLGHNGAGKTTSFKMIVGQIPASNGTIFFEGENITKMPMHKRCKKGIGYLGQEPTIFPTLTVEDNLKMVLEYYYKKKEIPEKIVQLLKELDLSHLRTSKAGSLSGGERRRLEITRSLIIQPKLIFFDEPFAGVDPKSRTEIKNLCFNLKEKGISTLITDHNAEAIFGMVDRLYLMKDGTIFASGTPTEMFENKDVKNNYLGDDFIMPKLQSDN